MEWSPNGSFVVLSTNSAVEVLDSKYNLKWSRTISGAQPSFLSYFNHPDRVHFSGDSASVYIRTSSGNYSQFDVATGALIRSHNFADWTGDYVLMPASSPSSGGMLLAVQVSVDGSNVETYKIRSYDEGTLALVNSTTLTHPYVSGVDFPAGRYKNRIGAAFYNKLVNPKDGTIVDYTGAGGAGTEAWTLGIDSDFGAVQSIVSVSGATYTPIGTRRIDGFGAGTWANTTAYVPGILSFAKTAGGTNHGFSSTGTGVYELNYLTGATNVVTASGVSSFVTGAGNVNPKDARIVIDYGNATGLHLDAFSTGDALTLLGTVAFRSGFANIEPANNGILVSGNSSFFGDLSPKKGTATWAGDSNGMSLGLTTSKSGAFAAAVYADHLTVLNAADGSPAGMYSGTYSRAFWAGDSKIIAVKADGSADFLNYSGGTITLGSALPIAFVSGGAATANGKYVLGYAGGSVHIINLTTLQDKLTSYPAFTTGWSDFFRIAPLADGRVALLEKTASGLRWQMYTLTGQKLNVDTSVQYVAPNAVSSSTNLSGDLNSVIGGPLGAFFSSNGVDAVGTPISELKFVRLVDGMVLGTVTNAIGHVHALRFAGDGSSLFVATGGGDDLGPDDLIALPVPAWLDHMTAPATSPSGSMPTVTAFLANPSPTTGTTINFSVTPNTASIPSSVVAGYGKMFANNTLTLPAVATDTDFTVTVTIPGFPESFSKVITDKAPIPTGVSFSPSAINAGNASTGTVTMAGIAPAGGYTVTLSSDTARVHVPASVTIAAGASSATFTATGDTGGYASDATISATANSVTATGALHVNATTLTVGLSPNTVVAGNNSTATVTINRPATSDTTITLSSSLTSASVPASVTILSGATSATFTVTVPASASATSPVITGTLDTKSGTATLTITATPVSTLTLSPTSLAAGASSTATVTLGGNAGTGGLAVALSYTGTGVSGPASVTIPAGTNTATYTVTTTASLTGQAATTTATLGASSKVANLTITPTQVTGFSITNASITGGTTNSTGTITLNAVAPTGGLVVTLTNDQTLYLDVPASITVPAGSSSVNFSWVSHPALSSKNCNLTAKIAGAGLGAVQTVIPPKVTTVVFATHTVAGGTSVSFTVTLDGPAPAGYSIALSSNNTGRMTVATPGKTTTGATTFTATVTTTAGGVATATLTATGIGGGTATDTLNLSS